MVIRLAKRLLAIPAVFDLYQSLIGAPGCHRRFVTDYVRPQARERILDVGCGTGNSVRMLPPGVDYLGIDISEAYIARAKALHQDRAFLVADAMVDGFRLGDESYDRAFAFGVLHHLSDSEVVTLIRNIMANLRPGAIFTTIDPCLVDGQHPLDRFLVRNDRGEHVRRPEHLAALLSSATSGPIESFVVHDMLRVPYSQVVMRMSAAKAG